MHETPKTFEELGWKDGTVAEFLELTPEESALIEIKLALSKRLRVRRAARMTQSELATKISSSQSRIANMGLSLWTYWCARFLRRVPRLMRLEKCWKACNSPGGTAVE